MAPGHARARADRSCASTCLGQAMVRERQRSGKGVKLDLAVVRVNGRLKLEARGRCFNHSRINVQDTCEKRGG